MSDAGISPQNQDVLLQIASLIRLAEGFRLGFVKCNQPIQCRRNADRLKEMLAGEKAIISVELHEPFTSLRRAVLQALEPDRPDRSGNSAIMIFGFEHSLPSCGLAPALDELNQSREIFPKSFSCPVIIWLPDYALTRLAREAPDFWGWRSGVFELAPELGVIAAVEKMAIVDPFSDGSNLSEKMEKASALEGLIRDYHELPKGERTDRSLAEVLYSLGNIRYQLGEYDQAHRLYQDSLKISQDLGDKSGVSRSLHMLGWLAQIAGDLDEARQLHQESLKIYQELGDRNGVSAWLHQLGILAQSKGDLDEARRLYQESLRISQELGDKNGVSLSLHQLGNLACLTGDFVEAKRFYQESLKISQDLGLKRNIALSLAQQSLLEEKEGNFDKALELIRKAESAFIELNSPIAVQANSDRQRLENIVKNVQ
jgi:tetratricopeptide (TPR) repeat protein